MEPLSITASAVLALFARKAVEKLGEGTGDSAIQVARSLAERVRVALSHRPDLVKDLDAVESRPDDTAASEQLGNSLDRAFTQDPTLRDAVDQAIKSDPKHLLQINNFLGSVGTAINIGVNQQGVHINNAGGR